MKIISIVIVLVLVVILMVCKCRSTTTNQQTYNQDDCICFTDYVNLYNPPLLKKDIARLEEGNWPMERGIGMANTTFKPGDDVYILISGTPEFIDRVQGIITDFAQPFVNLNFKFTTNPSLANYTIARGTPPGKHTGWATNIGGRKCTITLGNERQMNILHELGHALGMVHENTNMNAPVARSLVDDAQEIYGDEDMLRSAAKAPAKGKKGKKGKGPVSAALKAPRPKNATAFDIYSIMGIPSDDFKSERTDEYSDGDKLWLKNTYGEPGSGKSGKSGW